MPGGGWREKMQNSSFLFRQLILKPLIKKHMEYSEWPRSKENNILGYPVKSRGPENVFWSNFEIFMFSKACNGRGIQRSWPIGPRVGRFGWVTKKSEKQKYQKYQNVVYRSGMHGNGVGRMF